MNNMNNNITKQVDMNASGALGISHNETQDNSLISPLIKLSKLKIYTKYFYG